jgi:hypothetical protein
MTEIFYVPAPQEDYIRLHRDTIAGKLPQRYFLCVRFNSGLADQVVGIITNFYWALLTKRAFQFTPVPGLLDLREALEAPFINWTRHVDDPQHEYSHIAQGFKGLQQPDPRYDPGEVGSVYFDLDLSENEGSTAHYFSTKNLSKVCGGGGGLNEEDPL